MNHATATISATRRGAAVAGGESWGTRVMFSPGVPVGAGLGRGSRAAGRLWCSGNMVTYLCETTPRWGRTGRDKVRA
ncbi:hypothetical protein GCM10009850_021010 [Nonomuraea monospora]|uniref:Uncharacterized protein n=1 Tax=Nonomuraea monospora TaxID=568818 RepID=A0ABN3CBA0_9ACTN